MAKQEHEIYNRRPNDQLVLRRGNRFVGRIVFEVTDVSPQCKSTKGSLTNL